VSDFDLLSKCAARSVIEQTRPRGVPKSLAVARALGPATQKIGQRAKTFAIIFLIAAGFAQALGQVGQGLRDLAMKSLRCGQAVANV